ncbi:MAG: anthranilate phosphoribosyltransferase [Verrucomicrobium sp.]|nr:anthranilate phosphoribosyltransferase [Verrucomicrobium sp.]
MSILLSLAHTLKGGAPLDADQAGAAAETLFDPTIGDADRAAFLSALAEKGETAEELAAFARALLPRAAAVETADLGLPGPVLDCCGTGGGGLPLFNVSTAIAFVVAACGAPVAKHGNRGVTKPSGSIDVVEALGLRPALTPQAARESLRACGLAFLHAPAFHPGLAVVGPVRKSLGSRTIFNLLGPLLNPCYPGARLVGVFRPAHVPLYAEALKKLGAPRCLVAYGEVGGQPVGEASPTGENRLAPALPAAAPWAGEASLEGLLVADAAESAALVEAVLRGEGPPFGRALVAWNAALALAAQGRAASVAEGLALAEEALRSGAARAKLEQMRALP